MSFNIIYDNLSFVDTIKLTLFLSNSNIKINGTNNTLKELLVSIIEDGEEVTNFSFIYAFSTDHISEAIIYVNSVIHKINIQIDNIDDNYINKKFKKNELSHLHKNLELLENILVVLERA